MLSNKKFRSQLQKVQISTTKCSNLAAKLQKNNDMCKLSRRKIALNRNLVPICTKLRTALRQTANILATNSEHPCNKMRLRFHCAVLVPFLFLHQSFHVIAMYAQCMLNVCSIYAHCMLTILFPYSYANITLPIRLCVALVSTQPIYNQYTTNI